MCFRCCWQQVKECMVFRLFSRPSLSLAGNSGRLTRVRHSSHKNSRYLFLSVRAAFSCVQVYGIFNAHR